MDFLDRGEKKNANSLEQIIRKIVDDAALPARVIFIVDEITSENSLELLQRLRLLNDKRVSVLVIVRQEIYAKWSREVLGLVDELNFDQIYVPCLWEDQIKFIDTLIKEAFVLPARRQRVKDFRDHIAFVTRGAPGAVIQQVLGPKYCEIVAGNPILRLEKIQDQELIHYNARRQRILSRSWRDLLKDDFKGNEARDQARLGIYEIMDWIHSQCEFSWCDIQVCSSQMRISISSSGAIRDAVIRRLLDSLKKEGYLIEIKDSKNKAVRFTIAQ